MPYTLIPSDAPTSAQARNTGSAEALAMCSAGDPASVRMTLAIALCAASPAASRASFCCRRTLSSTVASFLLMNSHSHSNP